MSITQEEIGAMVPELREMKEPKTLEELMAQLAIISEAINRCEKMMQHLAMTGNGSEVSTYMSQYKLLFAEQERLALRQHAFTAQSHRAAEAAKKSWWHFW